MYFGLILGGEKYLYGKLYAWFPKILQWLATFFVIMISWIFFRAASLKSALKIIYNMFIPQELPFVTHIFDQKLFATIFILAIIFTFYPFIKPIMKIQTSLDKIVLLKGLAIFILLGISVVMISSSSFQAFIYEQF